MSVAESAEAVETSFADSESGEQRMQLAFGTDFGPVPMSPKLHIDLVDDMITDAGDRNKILSTNAVGLLRLFARTQLDRRGVAASD